MSRIGKLPIALPAGVQVDWQPGRITVKGPKGELVQDLPVDITVRQDASTLYVERPTDARHHRAQHGLARSLVNNMVTGVSTGFTKTLEVIGVGYRAQLDGSNLVLSLGLSHPVVMEPLEGVSFQVGIDTNTRMPFVIVSGANKENVGQQCALIRRYRPPEPYKGKGIRFRGEQIRRKAGKAGKAGAKGKK